MSPKCKKVGKRSEKCQIGGKVDTRGKNDNRFWFSQSILQRIHTLIFMNMSWFRNERVKRGYFQACVSHRLKARAKVSRSNTCVTNCKYKGMTMRKWKKTKLFTKLVTTPVLLLSSALRFTSLVIYSSAAQLLAK